MFRKKQEIGIIYSPLIGKIVPLAQVNDTVFSQEMLGKGFAVIPSEEVASLRMPANGKIVSVSDSLHAVNIITDDGLEILIHAGIDTVELRGKCFDLFSSSGSRLSRGDVIMNINFKEIEESGKETVTPVVITNPEIIDSMSPIFGNCTKDGCVAMQYKKKGGR